MTSPIAEVDTWFFDTGMVPADPGAVQAARLIGLQLDELGKKISVISAPMGNWMRQYALMFLGGECDQLMRERLANPVQRQALFAGDMAVLWYSVGAARALGGRVSEAFDATVASQLQKRWADGTYHMAAHSANVVDTPEGWAPVDYSSFLAP